MGSRTHALAPAIFIENYGSSGKQKQSKTAQKLAKDNTLSAEYALWLSTYNRRIESQKATTTTTTTLPKSQHSTTSSTTAAATAAAAVTSVPTTATTNFPVV